MGIQHLIDNYIGTEQHRKNYLDACKLGCEKIKREKQQRINDYNKNPKICANPDCSNCIPYEKQNSSKFCSRSCSAKVNNKGRKHKQDTKDKIGRKLSKWRSDNLEEWKQAKLAAKRAQRRPTYPHTNIRIKTCTWCGKKFVVKSDVNRKTCSQKCRLESMLDKQHSYINGRKKYHVFNHPTEGSIKLDSSWELEIAEILTERGIVWKRPRKSIPWYDGEKKRRYFPDFYLVDYDVYLDPKNPYGMKIGAEKLRQVSQVITLIYGDIEYIKSYINKLINWRQ